MHAGKSCRQMKTENQTRKKSTALRVALWVLLTPLALFVMLMALLYVPPVQDFIRQKATTLASEATGMQISVTRIDLRFPLNLLVRGAEVVQPADSASGQSLPPDTLLRLGSLERNVQDALGDGQFVHGAPSFPGADAPQTAFYYNTPPAKMPERRAQNR